MFSKRDINLVKRTLRYVRPYKKQYCLLILCVIFTAGLDIIFPSLLGQITGGFIEKKYSELAQILILFCTAQILNITVDYYKNYNTAYINNHIIFDINCGLFSKVLKLPVKAFDKMTIGQFLSRITGDTNVVSRIIVDQSLNFIINFIKVVIVGVIIFRTNILLAWIPIVIFPVFYIVYSTFGKKLREKNRNIRKINDKYYSFMHQTLLSIREIKCLGILKNSITTFRNNAKDINDNSIDMEKTAALSKVTSRFILFVTNTAILCAGGYLIYKGQLNISDYIAFSLYSSMFIESINSILMFNSTIQQLLASLERIFDLFDNLLYKDEEFGEKTIENIRGDIDLKNIFFCYEKGKSVLKNINIHIKPNRKVAIVGRSGAGKSTIFNLILKLYEPQGGQVYIDGIDINELTERTLRDSIAVVRQDPFLFNMSIKDNLLIANYESSEEDMIDACKAAYIHDYIMTLPEKYETVIGENGINLSCGQKQRIAITRGLLKKSRIFLLDEATSSLDNESQYYVKKAIDEIANDRTIVVIGHRLSTIKDADEIFVIDDGEVVGKGTHHMLINNNYFYKRIYEDEICMNNEVV